MSFGGHFGQPVPIATHQSVKHNLPHRPMRGDWHVLANLAAKNNLS